MTSKGPLGQAKLKLGRKRSEEKGRRSREIKKSLELMH